MKTALRALALTLTLTFTLTPRAGAAGAAAVLKDPDTDDLRAGFNIPAGMTVRIEAGGIFVYDAAGDRLATLGLTDPNAAGKVIGWNDTTNVLEWVDNGAGGGSGTVTSVGLTMPSGFAVAGSPVTTSGTLAVSTTLNGPLRGNGSGITTGNTNLASEVTGDLPFASLAQGSALSVLGVAGNATADVASIAAASDGQVMRRSGTSVGFGAVDLASANAVTGTLPGANVQAAGASNAGAINTGTQTIAGNKTFSGTVEGAQLVTPGNVTVTGNVIIGGGYVDAIEIASPATPSAGRARLYPKADGLWYSKDDAGVETLVSGGTGGVTISGDDEQTAGEVVEATDQRLRGYPSPNNTTVTTLTADKALASTDDPFLFYDPSGGDADHTITVSSGRAFMVVHDGASGTLRYGGSIVLTSKGQSMTLIYDGTEWHAWASNATSSGAGTKTIARWNALDNMAPAASYATLDARNAISVLDFDDSSEERAIFTGIVPEAAVLTSGLIVRIHWTATSATTGQVRWGVQFERGTTDLDSDSWDTATEAHSTTNGTSGVITVTAITATAIDSLAAGDAFRLRVYRDVTDTTNDTMTGDAEIVAVELRTAN